MPKSKVAITIEHDMLARLDQLVRQSVFPNRSRAIEVALEEKLARLDRSRLARECGKLDPEYEKAMADEGLTEDLDEWPEY
jgi:metal-responsive CopG/Arc/MetJ family transcriptional regulator